MKKISSLLLAVVLAFGIGAQGVLAAPQTKKLLPVEPRVKAKAAISFDVTADEVILEKNMNEKMYPASITKLMTALLLAENTAPDKDLPISIVPLEQPAFAINKSMYILYPGDTIKAEAAMKAILLPSANDIAVVAAEDVGGSVAGFVTMMNEKAKELGMNNTNFANPSGLHDPNHYTTAADLVKLVKAAYENDWVRETIATETANIRTENQKVGEIKNSNQLLGKDGNVGGKTGFTDEAGRCLVGVYVRDGREIIQVLLNDGDSVRSTLVFTDMGNLANEAYALEKIAMVEKDTPVDSITAEYKLFRWFGPTRKVQIKATIQDDLLLYNNTANYVEGGIVPVITPIKDLNVFELREGNPVAEVTVVSNGKTLTTKAISQTNTMDSIIMPNAVPYLAMAIGLFLLFIIILIIIYKLLRSRKSTQRNIRSHRQVKRRKASKHRY